MEVEIWTDGACICDLRKGGIGCVLRYNEYLCFICKSYGDVTNNQMELKAVIESLKLLKCRCKVVIYSDSSYVVQNVKHNNIYEWKKRKFKNIKNKELWCELINIMKIHSVRFVKIKAHNEIKLNEWAHNLANVGVEYNYCYVKRCKYA